MRAPAKEGTMREPRSRSRWVIVAMLAGKGPGVALGMDPPVWLKDGDVVELMITGIGTLTNKVKQIG
jgi:hypothetical protein